MAAKANSKLVSWVCLLAILLLAVPFAVCAPMPHAMMAAMHCAECCPTNAAPTPASCCTSQPQANLPQAQQTMPLAQASVLYLPLALAPSSRAMAKPQSAPPPLLRTPLRI